MVENQSTSIRKYPKRIPYGMMNFKAVIEDDCYYVDKTPFVEKIERANKFFFYLHPRRFGKSLTLSMLEHYYDINRANIFDKLFGHLYRVFVTGVSPVTLDDLTKILRKDMQTSSYVRCSTSIAT